jgi:hypothetical protein
MTVVERATRDELVALRNALVHGLGLTSEELRDRAEQGVLVGEEWETYAAVRDVNFLLAE